MGLGGYHYFIYVISSVASPTDYCLGSTKGRYIMHLSATDKVRVSDQVLSQEVRGEIVLLDLASESYFGLDSVSAKVWQLIGKEATVGEIVSALLSDYEFDEAQLESDINELMESFLQAGIVTLVDDET